MDSSCNKREILKKVDMLYQMWKNGELGGEVMMLILALKNHH